MIHLNGDFNLEEEVVGVTATIFYSKAIKSYIKNMQTINRTKFFTELPELRGKPQIVFLLDKLDNSTVIDSLAKYAYVLATIQHETAGTFKPIKEIGSYNYFKYLIGKLGILNLEEANKYKGKGYVQITGKTNYKKFGELLGIDLLGEPDLALDPEISWQILEIGMSKGLFTGKALKDYIEDTNIDFVGARKIINGKDRAQNIAQLARKFFNALSYNSEA